MDSPTSNSCRSKSHQSRLKAYRRIKKLSSISAFPCERCYFSNRSCFVMPSSGRSRLHCVECRRRGRRCVEISWDAVDRSVTNAQEEVRRSESEYWDTAQRLSQLQAQLSEKRQVLEAARQRATEQLRCLKAELDAEGEGDAFTAALKASSLEAALRSADTAPGVYSSQDSQ